MGSPARLTPTMRSRKLLALDFIKRYFAQWGVSPSLDEVGAALDVSKQRAAELVHQLADEQMIEREAGKTRGIRLIDRGEEISEAEVLVRLAGSGWRVIQGDKLIVPPLTENGLNGLPELSHDPGLDRAGS